MAKRKNLAGKGRDRERSNLYVEFGRRRGERYFNARTAIERTN